MECGGRADVMTEFIENRCVGCGGCCKAPHTCYPYENYVEICRDTLDYYRRGLLSDAAFADNDCLFVAVNWTEITIDEACERNPYLIRKKHDYIRNGMHFFKCKQFDMATNRCNLHGTPFKPHICSQYPIYGKEVCPPGEEKNYIRPEYIDYSPVCGWNTTVCYADPEPGEKPNIKHVIYTGEPKHMIEDAGCGC
jgi:Fe-S-cluster containining protein